MPNFDKTGPRGEGPKTGRQKGSCIVNEKDNSYGIRRRCGLGVNREFNAMRRRREN